MVAAIADRPTGNGDGPCGARNLLNETGLRATRQRLAIAKLLFGREFRHVSAESLHEELVRSGAPGSISSVYRNLRDLSGMGLLKRAPIYGSKAWFDTRTGHHHHFYAEDEDRLLDMPAGRLSVENVPPPPDGYELVGVEVLVRIRRRA